MPHSLNFLIRSSVVKCPRLLDSLLNPETGSGLPTANKISVRSTLLWERRATVLIAVPEKGSEHAIFTQFLRVLLFNLVFLLYGNTKTKRKEIADRLTECSITEYGVRKEDQRHQRRHCFFIWTFFRCGESWGCLSRLA